MTSKCGKNKKVAQEAQPSVSLVCHCTEDATTTLIHFSGFFLHTLKVMQVTRQFLTVKHFFIFTGCILLAEVSNSFVQFSSRFWKINNF